MFTNTQRSRPSDSVFAELELYAASLPFPRFVFFLLEERKIRYNIFLHFSSPKLQEIYPKFHLCLYILKFSKFPIIKRRKIFEIFIYSLCATS